MDVLQKIKSLMAERQWTEYRLAKNANLSQSTIKNIFQRNNVPTVATIEKLCDAFGITLSQFFATNDDLVSLKDADVELLKHWSKLSDEQKESFLNVLKNM
ncbi:helix-turn-helix transcriptional regulator [Bengtsoniella intestinalis]|uniref:helix-turn-helix domain-containing protein n=1 Tax=Bengtsoniella intestinalis TaxID=3073143 RepID=UPI00391F2248